MDGEMVLSILYIQEEESRKMMTKKRIRKVIAILLIAIMTMSLGVSAFATEIPNDETVSAVETEGGLRTDETDETEPLIEYESDETMTTQENTFAPVQTDKLSVSVDQTQVDVEAGNSTTVNVQSLPATAALQLGCGYCPSADGCGQGV